MIASATTLTRTEAALRALLTPLQHASMQAWLASAGGPVKDLFGADFISLVAAPPGGTMPYSELEPAARAAYESYFGAMDPFRARLVRVGLEVGHPWMVTSRAALVRTEFYADFLVPNRLGVALALVPGGRSARHAVSICFQDWLDEPVLEDHVEVLRLLVPAFRVGLDAWSGFCHHRTALSGILDAVAVGSRVSDLQGRRIHSSAALERMLAADPERSTVEGEIDALGQGVAALAARRSPGAPPQPPLREVQTARTRYRLQGSILAEGILGSNPLVLVTVEDRGVQPVDADELRERFRLTPREVEVAGLVAEGLSNKQIARRLSISPYTARNHVERVLRKLDVSSRARVAGLLRGPGR